jgi:hypothetical protein
VRRKVGPPRQNGWTCEDEEVLDVMVRQRTYAHGNSRYSFRRIGEARRRAATLIERAFG